jgi:hypothetical protein
MTTDPTPSVVSATLHPKRLDPATQTENEAGKSVARVRLGLYEFKKKGVSRFDLRDPYHLAVALSWPRFGAALLALYLSVNVVFATLLAWLPARWRMLGRIASRTPSSSASRRWQRSAMARCIRGYSYRRVVAATEIVCGLGFTAILPASPLSASRGRGPS